MATLPFKRGWVEFKTPCPHFPNIKIGDLQCTQCPYHLQLFEEFSNGEVECLYED